MPTHRVPQWESTPCGICRAGDHCQNDHYDVAFTNPVTEDPYPVPADIRAAAERIARAYGVRGICDPMYIANVIARELKRGDGCSNFYDDGAS